MNTSPMPERAKLPEGWVAVTEFGQNLEAELTRELADGHPLFGCAARAIAQRLDCDDVLFTTNLPHYQYAVVHLTWSQSPEPDPRWPASEAFGSFDEWCRRARVE